MILFFAALNVTCFTLLLAAMDILIVTSYSVLFLIMRKYYILNLYFLTSGLSSPTDIKCWKCCVYSSLAKSALTFILRLYEFR